MKRDIIVLSVLAAAAFAILVALGAWQLQRLEWKQSLIAQLDARMRAEPVTLTQARERLKAGEDIEYLRVRAKGEFLHDKERHLYTVQDGKAGWRIITPLGLENGRFVLVDRGFVPEALKPAATRPGSTPTGSVLVTGVVRLPGDKGYFTPDNAPAENIWHWRDLDAMAASVLDGEQVERVEPFFIQQEEMPSMTGWPRAGYANLNLPNRHLEYALTWFALAGVLLVVFAFYLRSRLRARPFT